MLLKIYKIMQYPPLCSLPNDQELKIEAAEMRFLQRVTGYTFMVFDDVFETAPNIFQ